jgi:hypothetical protein
VRLQGEMDFILSEQSLKSRDPAAQNGPINLEAELEIRRIRKDMQRFTEILRQGQNRRQSSYLAFSPAVDISILRQVRIFLGGTFLGDIFLGGMFLGEILSEKSQRNSSLNI